MNRFILAEKANFSIRLLCRVLDVSRLAYYDWLDAGPSRCQSEDLALSVHIKAIHRRSRRTYGSPRIHAELVAEGHEVGRHRVARLMRKHGLSGTPKKRFRGSTTDSDHELTVAPNRLDRDFTADLPNKAWVGDITYLHTTAGWVYLAVLIDLFSRKVVGWALGDHMRTDLCLKAFDRAASIRQPAPGLVHHTDRGSQYASARYDAALREVGAQASMSRKGSCWDNAPSESFFGTLEQELVQQTEPWADATEARAAVSDYIHGFYNPTRRHSTLGYLSPNDFEQAALVRHHESGGSVPRGR